MYIIFVCPGKFDMAFPEPRPQAPQLPNHLLRTIDCQQGAVRAVRFNGKTAPFQLFFLFVITFRFFGTFTVLLIPPWHIFRLHHYYISFSGGLPNLPIVA